jgi:hypothetical protein
MMYIRCKTQAILAVVFTLIYATHAFAGPYEDGLDAYNAGN